MNPTTHYQEKPHHMFDDFERLAEQSQDAIYHFSIAEKRFLFFNRRFREFFSLGDFAARKVSAEMTLAAIHPEDRESAFRKRRSSILGDQTEGEAEYRVLSPTERIRWLHDRWVVIRDNAGNAVAVEGFVRDNSQQKVAERQFIDSAEKALIGNFIAETGKFKYVNPEFVRITGYSAEELIDTDPLSIVQESYREHVRKNAVAMLKGDSNTPYEFCIYDKSGETRWIMETVTPILYQNRRATLGYFMDITKLRKIQGNLSTLGLMIGTISHSLRGCLTGLDASLYLIETGFYRDMPGRIEEGLDVTKLMADRIRKLVTDILYYAKERKPDYEEVKVWQFANEVAATIENRIKAANVQFMKRFPVNPVTIRIDVEIFRAALVNILENALEACINDERQGPHRIGFSARVDADNVYFEIADNGPGIEKDQLHQIFQLFYSSKGNRGTGIGLFVTRKAILDHGGSITVDSSPGKGARFIVQMPKSRTSQVE